MDNLDPAAHTPNMQDDRLRQQEALQTPTEILIPPLPEPLHAVPTPESHMPTLASYAWERCRAEIQQRLQKVFGKDAPLVVIDPTDQKLQTDFAIPTHKFAGQLQRGNENATVAAEVAQGIQRAHRTRKSKESKLIRAIRNEGAFVNVDLDKDKIATLVMEDIESKKEQYGEVNIGNGETIVIDCSSPNIAKFMSVGHLRSTVIGESLARLYRAAGYRVIRDNHLGDWGTQFGKLGAAFERWGGSIEQHDNPVQMLYELYVKMNDEIENEKRTSQNFESELEDEGRRWFAKLENGTPEEQQEARKLWQWALEQSLGEFQRVYDLLGVDFEYMIGESFYIPMLFSVVNALIEKQIAYTDETGAIRADVRDVQGLKLSDKNKTPVIQKKDGTSLYAVRDLAALAARTEWFHPGKILYVVGGEQKDYFTQLFAIFQKLKGEESPYLEHIFFGNITLPEGKMSTRKGNVVFLEDVLRESIDRAKKIITEAGRGLRPDEIEEIARQVGVGAVIYSDLKQGRERDIKFDWNSALSFEGNSAPYMQYTRARAVSILRTAEEKFGIQIDRNEPVRLVTDGEYDIIRLLAQFPNAIKRAVEKNQPAVLSEYLFKLTGMFNQFYHDERILDESVISDPEKLAHKQVMNTRLRLTEATATVIKQGLWLLGIESPERM